MSLDCLLASLRLEPLLRFPGAVGICRLIVRDIVDCPDPLRSVRDAIDHAEITRGANDETRIKKERFESPSTLRE